MTRLNKLFFTLTTSTLIVTSGLSMAQEALIYGKDNRKEINQYSDSRFVKLSQSVALRVSNDRLSINEVNPLITDFFKIPLNKGITNLCPSEKYQEQYSLGECTGVLIAKNKILTAGHCVFSDSDCENNSWVFDYTNNKESLLSKDVYKCAKIEVQKYEYSADAIKDYAIIELDRETDREPVKFRHYGFPFTGTPLVLIGHPMGLPMKIADGANVKLPNEKELQNFWQSIKLREYYFTTNTDSYAGNSGSPVFNQWTGKMEGILIQGADDFEYNKELGCIQSRRNSNSFKTSFEKVLRTTEIPELFNY